MRKSSEEVLQQVLAGLRDCEASTGIERRILDSIRDRASAESASSWRGLRPVWLVTLAGTWAMRPLAWGLALGGVIAVVLPVSVIYRIGHSPTRSNVQAVPAARLPAAAVGKIAKEARPLQAGSIARSGGAATPGKRMPIGASDSAALRDMRATDHPAPPAPLTQEERTLLRIAHTGDPQALAMLNPEVRARQEAESEAEFQRFVGEAIKGDRE